MSPITYYLDQLWTVIRTVATEQGIAWLEQARHQLHSSEDIATELLLLSAMGRRQLGQRPVGQTALSITTPAGVLPIGHWSAGDAGRVILLLTTMQRQPEREIELVSGVYRYGDELERAAVIRGLSLFPAAQSLKSIALETGRFNSLTLYQALALANPYPAAYYSDHEFNQLVLKSMFLGLPLAAIEGLPRRTNPELARMCEDYLNERVAANRPIPADLWLALGPHASERGEQLMIAYTRHEEPRQRYYATLALSSRLAIKPTLRSVLMDRLLAETDEQTLKMLRDSLIDPL